MRKRIDQACGWILILGACGHTGGTLLWLPKMSAIWIWSLGSALAALLLGAMNLLRASRENDQALAWITTVGTFCWGLVAVAFGVSIGNLLDPRPLMHAVDSLALVGFSVATLFRIGKINHSSAVVPVRT
jgi:membrane protein DedA with SNARE-associated domain